MCYFSSEAEEIKPSNKKERPNKKRQDGKKDLKTMNEWFHQLLMRNKKN